MVFMVLSCFSFLLEVVFLLAGRGGDGSGSRNDGFLNRDLFLRVFLHTGGCGRGRFGGRSRGSGCGGGGLSERDRGERQGH